MELTIKKEKAEFNKSKYGNNKKCVIVQFPNCSFKWMPTYKQLEDIKKALDEIEEESWNNTQLNKQEVKKMQIQEFTKATGNFLKAADVIKDNKKIFVITGEAKLVTSERFNTERLQIPGEFAGEKKIFDCSKTNARGISDSLGFETKDWIGKIILLDTYKTKTSDGVMTDAINFSKVISENEIGEIYLKS